MLGPELYDFFIAAIMETWRETSDYELCTFRTRDDYQMTGRRSTAAGEEFTIGDSEYADDTGLAFCTRTDVEEQTPLIMSHFSKWGMEIHSGILDPLVHAGLLDCDALPEEKASKSEVLFCAKPPHLYANPATFDGADLSPILLPDGRFMPVVDKFPYLGDIISRDGSDTEAVHARVSAGSKAFGALRGCVFATSEVNNTAKKAVYEAIVLSITLYGCETWSLTESQLHRLRVMHAHHLRVMSHVSRTRMWDEHISTQELGQRLRIDSIDTSITRRQLRWLGHVARMDFDRRLPRRMLSAWVPHPRPVGAPTMTYGRSIGKALAKFNVDEARWAELALDRGAWRQMLRAGLAPEAYRPRPPSPPPPSPPPLSRTKPSRACAARTMTAIDGMRAKDAVLQRILKPINR